ncbi:MAG: type II secretion system protein GspJ, partial [Planctomycetota bacterium]
RRIRCSYARAPQSAKAAPRETLPKTRDILREPVNYFRGGLDPLTGEVLHFVTAARVYPAADLRYGLIEVVYKLDRTTSTLMVSERRFVETAMPLVEERHFTTAMEGVENIEPAFFNGSQWSPEWDYSETRKLPAAVRISIACKDENGRLCEYATTAQIYCLRKPPGKKNSTFGQ